MLTDGAGVPLALAVDGANRHDKKLVGRTLNNLAAARPARRKQNLRMDKGYDYPDVRELVAKRCYTAHTVARGEERQAQARIPGYRAALDRRAYAFVVQPVPSPADPLGKEGRQLHGDATLGLRVHYAPGGRGYGIGS